MPENFVSISEDRVKRAEILLQTARVHPTEFVSTQLGKVREVIVAYYGGCKGININAYGADALGATGNLVEIKTTIPWKSGTIAFNYGPINQEKRLKLSGCEHLLAVFTPNQELEEIYFLSGLEWEQAISSSKAIKNMKLTLKKAIQFGAKKIWSTKPNLTMNMTILNTNGMKTPSTMTQMTIDNLGIL